MIVIVSGSRNRTAFRELVDKFEALRGILDIVIHGDAAGIDSCAARAAKEAGVQQIRVPANWDGEGKGAGPKRNSLMACIAAGLCQEDFGPVFVWAFPAKNSVGTRHMIEIAEFWEFNLTVFEEAVENPQT